MSPQCVSRHLTYCNIARCYILRFSRDTRFFYHDVDLVITRYIIVIVCAPDNHARVYRGS